MVKLGRLKIGRLASTCYQQVSWLEVGGVLLYIFLARSTLGEVGVLSKRIKRKFQEIVYGI